MQDAPDKGALLGGVAMFLMGQVEPALKAAGQRGLAFRARIAAHLISTVYREIIHEGEHDAAEWGRLTELLGALPEAYRGDSSDPGAAGLTEALPEANARLACALRDDDAPIDEAATRAALMATLRDRLMVVQPRFDTRIDLKESQP